MSTTTCKKHKNALINSASRCIKSSIGTNEIQETIKKDWILQPHIKTCLDSHFLLYWSPTYFLQQLESFGKYHCIHKEGRIFMVYFHRCTLEDCRQAFLDNLNVQLVLSFRATQHKDGIPSVVLVSIKK